MAHLIDKDAALAKIDSEIKLLEPYLGACAGQIVAEANSKNAAYNRVKDILNTLEVKEVDLEDIIKSHFNVKNLNDVKIITTGRNLLNLAMHINKFAMNAAFEQYSQIGESTGNDSLNEEIEKTIKMNDMWCGLMPNTLIKYTAKHFFELGLKVAQKGK